MIQVVLLAAQALVLGLAGYNLITSLWGWKNPRPRPSGSRRTRFRVVVPAHNEAAVIRGVLADLAGQDYPDGLVSVWVVADGCTDSTASLAREQGVAVLERSDGAEGKAAVLSWYLSRQPLADDESLVVLDADNRVPVNLLARFAEELDDGGDALQAYLDVVDPDSSTLSAASALSYWASNRMVQLARTNLGWGCDLGGTGMCLSARALDAVGGLGSSRTEDQDLTGRLLLAGIKVVWLHDVRVKDDKPDSIGVAVRQRTRWAGGKAAVARRLGPALVRYGLTTRSWSPLDLAIRLAQPSRTFIALIAGALAVLAAVFPEGGLFPWPLWATAGGVLFLAPLAFLARDGVAARYLVRYPLVAVFGLLWPVARVLGFRHRDWYHTPHGN